MACVRCSLGKLLTNGNVIDIFHACFRIGHYQPERSKGTTGGAMLSSSCARCSSMMRQLALLPKAVSVGVVLFTAEQC